MALSNNPDEAHISPWAPYPKHVSEQAGNALHFPLLLNPCSSRDQRPPQGTSQSSEAGTPLGAPRCCHVSHTVCHTEHRACNTLSSKATVVCFGLLFSFLFALGWEKKIPFHLGKMWKPLSQAIISSGRGKFPQRLDQALVIGMAPCCCARSGSHCLWDS